MSGCRECCAPDWSSFSSCWFGSGSRATCAKGLGGPVRTFPLDPPRIPTICDMEVTSEIVWVPRDLTPTTFPYWAFLCFWHRRLYADTPKNVSKGLGGGKPCSFAFTPTLPTIRLLARRSTSVARVLRNRSGGPFKFFVLVPCGLPFEFCGMTCMVRRPCANRLREGGWEGEPYWGAEKRESRLPRSSG